MTFSEIQYYSVGRPIHMRAPRRLWPDSRQTLLLHAALGSAVAASHAWSRLTASIPPGALDAWLRGLDLGSRRLLPLVWSNLGKHGVEGPTVAALASHYQAAHDLNERFVGEAGGVLSTLAAHGVPTIVLKGGALIGRLYEDLGARPVADLDLLVPHSRVAEAARVLRAVGFEAESPITDAALRFTHSAAWNRNGSIPVDLHWHVYEECCRPGDDDDLWDASMAATVGNVPTRVLAMEDQLIHTCVHGEKWVRVPGLRWIADAVTMVRRCALNWDRVVTQAAARGFALRLHAQFSYLVTEFDAPIPANALRDLAAVRSTALERFEHRFGVRDRRRPWALVYWCNHIRATDGGVLRAATTFPRYLQAIWRLESMAHVPRAGAERVVRHVRGRA